MHVGHGVFRYQVITVSLVLNNFLIKENDTKLRNFFYCKLLLLDFLILEKFLSLIYFLLLCCKAFNTLFAQGKVFGLYVLSWNQKFRIFSDFQVVFKCFLYSSIFYIINSRTAIAGAIIGLLFVFFISSSWFLLRPYDVTATFCSFVHAISTELHVWRHFSLLVERVFLFMRVIKFLVILDLPHSQKWLSIWNWLLFTLIQRDKVKWVCVTLNEGYLRSANRGSNNLYRFLIKI